MIDTLSKTRISRVSNRSFDEVGGGSDEIRKLRDEISEVYKKKSKNDQVKNFFSWIFFLLTNFLLFNPIFSMSKNRLSGTHRRKPTARWVRTKLERYHGGVGFYSIFV